MVCIRILLFCFVINVFVPARNLLYQTEDKVYTIKMDAANNFEEAKSYCRSLPNGEIAMIKNRDLALNIEIKVISIVKTGKLVILKSSSFYSKLSLFNN